MKKNLLLFILLSVAGVVSLFADTWTDSNGVKWDYEVVTYNDVTGAAIRGVENCPTEVVVPGMVGEDPIEVKWICHPEYYYQDLPFRDNKILVSVTLPESVIGLGQEAFRGCSSLTTINGLSACTSIGSNAFSDCTSLVSIGDLPSCTSIGFGAFSGCTSLVSIGNLPVCTRIEGHTFYKCTSLTNIGDLSACTSIDDQALYNCSSLACVGNLPVCTSIGSGAFYDCTSLTSIGDLPVCTSIGSSSFWGCSSLTSVGDLTACTSIGGYAFCGCSSLTSVGDLSACTSIGSSAFYFCSSLTSIGDLSACTNIGENAFQGCYTLSSIGNLTSLTRIGSEAFDGCKISEISIGSGATLDNPNAFPECTTILVPEADVATYRTANFWSNLAVRIISKDAKRNWDITITETPAAGSAVQNAIGEKNLGNVTSLKITGNINSYDFFVMRNNMPNLHVVDLTDANIVASDYKYYSDFHTEDNIFPQCGFYQQGKLTHVIFPKSITAIGEHALAECRNMCWIDMYPGIVTIGACSFKECLGVTELVIPEGVETLGHGMCYDYGNWSMALKRVVLPSTLKRIESDCFFGGCDKLEFINLPSSLEYIGGGAFQWCYSLSEITLPASLTFIGGMAFSGCNNLRVVKATAIDPNSVTMSDDSFDNYSNKTIYLPIDEKSGWDATYNAYYWHTQWGQFNTKLAWNPTYDNVNIGGDYDQNKGTIPGDNIDANFGQNAGYILGQLAQQFFDKLKIKHDGKDGASIIDENSKLTANELTCDITVDADKWYFFCFPFDVNISQIQAPGESVWRKYNAAVRASVGQGGWQKLGNSEKTLKAGQGYIFQCNTAGTLVITVDNPDFSDDNKSAQLKENVAANAQDASWNFVGNPFLSYYELADLGHNAPVTIWTGNGYEAVRPGDDDYALQPFQAFFVQKTAGSDEVTVDKDKRETKQQSEKKVKAAKARRAKQAINPDRLLINLELTDGETIDKTRVVFNDRQRMDYEPECDAAKFMSTEQVPQLYTYYNNVNYAINERPNSDTEVRLAFKAPKAGEYTISAARMDTPVLLRDTELGITFDFQTGSYTFECKAGTNDKRFILVKNNTATAIHPVTIGDAESAEFFNLAGQKTNANAKGVVISNGKKLLKK